MTSPNGTIDAASSRAGRLRGFWEREIPYLLILLLTAIGIGWLGMTRQPIILYWNFVAVFIAGVCLYAGLRDLGDQAGRWRLIWTQLLHWGAFVVAINILFLPSVQAIVNVDATGLVVLFLLALGTFIAGVHTGSPRMAANGVVMAAAVPAIAWLDQSALLLTLVVVLVAALVAALAWNRIRDRGAGHLA